MRGKKKLPNQVAQLRKIGIVEHNLNPVQRSGLYWRSAHKWIPRVDLWIKICCMVALLGALACLLIVVARPRPVLLVSFPDGTTLCSLPPVDQETGAVIPRPSKEAELCQMLIHRSGRASDEQNVEFSKLDQKQISPNEGSPIDENKVNDAVDGAPQAAPPLENSAPSTPETPLEVQPATPQNEDRSTLTSAAKTEPEVAALDYTHRGA